MEKEFIFGRMVENIKVVTIMIKNMERVSIIGLMVRYSKENGSTARDKAKENI